MKKENLIYLVVGFAFGILIGYGTFKAVGEQPNLDQGMETSSAMAPAGPRAPGQGGGAALASGDAGGAPMMNAIRELKKRIEGDPTDRMAMVQLANMYHEISMCEQASEYYEQALAIERQPAELIGLGICKRVSREFDEAMALLEEANEMDPSNWQPLFNIAIVAGFDLQQFDIAFAAVEKLESMDPTPPRLGELRQALETAQAGGQPSGG